MDCGIDDSMTNNVDDGMAVDGQVLMKCDTNNVDGLGIDGSMTGNVDYGMAVNGLRY